MEAADYYWLGFTAVGLIGASGQARHLVAKNMEPNAAAHASWEYNSLLDKMNLYSEDPGLICRTFTTSPFLSEAERYAVQTQFDAACKWMKDVSHLVPPKEPGGPLKPTPGPLARRSTTRAINSYKTYLSMWPIIMSRFIG
jgi:hypothetical protein